MAALFYWAIFSVYCTLMFGLTIIYLLLSFHEIRFLMAYTLNTLLERMHEISDYPPYLKPVTKEHQLDGLSFFPCGDGRLKEHFERITELPQKNVMIVGSDWGAETYFNTKRKSNSENTSRTWAGIRDIVSEYRIANKESIFFTNAIMGLRTGDMKDSNTKPLPIWKERINSKFYNQNIEFFKVQLELIRPKYIIGLGVKVANFLGDVFEEVEFKKAKKFSDLGIATDVTFKNDSIKAFIIFHPSFRTPNRSRDLKRAQIEDSFFTKNFKL